VRRPGKHWGLLRPVKATEARPGSGLRQVRRSDWSGEMNQYLRRCVEDFERVSTEIGFLPALLWATLIIIMTVVGFGVALILVSLVLPSRR
jgi:hypothetical protein